MIKQKKARFNDPPPSISELTKQNALRDDELDDFNKYIKGLKTMYMIPNQPNTRRVMRMNGTRQPCVSQRSVFHKKPNITRHCRYTLYKSIQNIIFCDLKYKLVQNQDIHYHFTRSSNTFRRECYRLKLLYYMSSQSVILNKFLINKNIQMYSSLKKFGNESKTTWAMLDEEVIK